MIELSGNTCSRITYRPHPAHSEEDVARAILADLSMANPLWELGDEREARAKCQAVRTVLQARFGALPEAVEQRIAVADADQLDALIGRAATVTSPDEL